MRAVTITKAGGPEVLTVSDHAVRAAEAAEVRIAVRAAAVNPTDILMRENPEVYAKGSPGIPGMDAAGVVESVGEDVERWKVGDEVMAVVTPRRPEGVASRSAGVVVGDLSSAVETRSVADQVNAIGRMDAVIHNAGISSTRGRSATQERHASIFAVNTESYRGCGSPIDLLSPHLEASGSVGALCTRALRRRAVRGD